MTETLREALDETQRMLEYLWTATGNRAPDLPVCDLFNDDDPIIQDVPTVIGRARMAVARSEPPSPEGLTEALDVPMLTAALVEALSAMDDEWIVDECAEYAAAEYARLRSSADSGTEGT